MESCEHDARLFLHKTRGNGYRFLIQYWADSPSGKPFRHLLVVGDPPGSGSVRLAQLAGDAVAPQQGNQLLGAGAQGIGAAESRQGVGGKAQGEAVPGEPAPGPPAPLPRAAASDRAAAPRPLPGGGAVRSELIQIPECLCKRGAAVRMPVGWAGSTGLGARSDHRNGCRGRLARRQPPSGSAAPPALDSRRLCERIDANGK
jgi:hypothetical protein